jgi:DNA-binding NarL/FixJ family response regulator
VTGAAEPIRVVIADDHPMFRFGLAAVLAAAPGIEIVGEASDGDELLSLVTAEAPDVVITDLSMPGRDGLSALLALGNAAGEGPAPRTLVLSMHEDDEHLFAALRAGACGYLVKGADGSAIIRAVESVARGDAVYGAAVARRIIEAGTRAKEPFPDLTGRERDVLRLLADGLRNHQIAERLGLSDKTVRNHVSAILAKLQVSDRTAAALKARAGGLGR